MSSSNGLHVYGIPVTVTDELEPDEVRAMIADESFKGFADAILNQDEIGDPDIMMLVDVSGEGGQGAVRHTSTDRGHVLE